MVAMYPVNLGPPSGKHRTTASSTEGDRMTSLLTNIIRQDKLDREHKDGSHIELDREHKDGSHLETSDCSNDKDGELNGVTELSTFEDPFEISLDSELNSQNE